MAAQIYGPSDYVAYKGAIDRVVAFVQKQPIGVKAMTFEANSMSRRWDATFRRDSRLVVFAAAQQWTDRYTTVDGLTWMTKTGKLLTNRALCDSLSSALWDVAESVEPTRERIGAKI